MRNEKNIYKIVADPPKGFPLKKGSVITVPEWMTNFEYRDEKTGRLASIRLDDSDFLEHMNPMNRLTVIHIPESTKAEKKSACTLKSVEQSFKETGFLEGYQVEWLIEALQSHKEFLLQLREIFLDNEQFWNAETMDEPLSVEFTPEHIRMLIEELKTTS